MLSAGPWDLAVPSIRRPATSCTPAVRTSWVRWRSGYPPRRSGRRRAPPRPAPSRAPAFPRLLPARASARAVFGSPPRGGRRRRSGRSRPSPPGPRASSPARHPERRRAALRCRAPPRRRVAGARTEGAVASLGPEIEPRQPEQKQQDHRPGDDERPVEVLGMARRRVSARQARPRDRNSTSAQQVCEPPAGGRSRSPLPVCRALEFPFPAAGESPL